MTPDEAYPFWRWHMFETGQGSYMDIEQKEMDGDLLTFTCPDIHCDCPWTKLYCELPSLTAFGRLAPVL